MESRVAEAMEFISENPKAKPTRVAQKYSISRKVLANRIMKKPPRGTSPATNKLLSDPEEAAICRYIDRLDAINLAVKPEFVEDAANAVLAARCSRAERANPPTTGSRWTTRFLKRHGYFKRKQKKLDTNRKDAENVEVVKRYFQQLQEVIGKHGIQPTDIWNMDETGFRIGMGKDQMIVTKRKRAHYRSIRRW